MDLQNLDQIEDTWNSFKVEVTIRSPWQDENQADESIFFAGVNLNEDDEQSEYEKALEQRFSRKLQFKVEHVQNLNENGLSCDDAEIIFKDKPPTSSSKIEYLTPSEEETISSLASYTATWQAKSMIAFPDAFSSEQGTSVFEYFYYFSIKQGLLHRSSSVGLHSKRTVEEIEVAHDDIWERRP
mmetsp:Transcript_7770/g.12038  ORF Transcript_7770/g.12038 Transcript_7770/m.12038 type:complete len:184 (+) Transcript_7770:304-855(+)